MDRLDTLLAIAYLTCVGLGFVLIFRSDWEHLTVTTPGPPEPSAAAQEALYRSAA